ncbi:hypothetical protein GF357_03980 [Candidatus Dojkabacteria bacterium]|nr:hypothetical protein [Candidatus Dojkabacteria bacterium]
MDNNKNDNFDLNNFFTNDEIFLLKNTLELSENEIYAYIVLTQNPYSTITELAKYADFPRTNMNRYIQRLLEKGLVTLNEIRQNKLFTVANPAKIQLLINEKEIELQNKKQQLRSVTEKLPSLMHSINCLKSYRRSKGKYRNGKKYAQDIYTQAFSSKELCSYVSLESSHTFFPENEEKYLTIQDTKPSKQVKEIIDKSKISVEKASEYSKAPNFDFIVSPVDMNLSSVDILIFDGRVAIVNLNKKISICVLSNTSYYKNCKAIFDLMWNVLI